MKIRISDDHGKRLSLSLPRKALIEIKIQMTNRFLIGKVLHTYRPSSPVGILKVFLIKERSFFTRTFESFGKAQGFLEDKCSPSLNKVRSLKRRLLAVQKQSFLRPQVPPCVPRFLISSCHSGNYTERACLG